MKYSTLGSTGLDVSVVSYGTSPLGGTFGGVADLDAASRAIQIALDSGINLFDSSPLYGDGLAEERLGKCLVGRREEVLISTKVGHYADGMDFRPQTTRRSVQASLERLQTDYVDVLMFHDIENVELETLFEDCFGELVALKDEGICRFIGVTGYPIHTIKRAITELDLDVVLNYAHATLLNDELISQLVPVAAERGVGLINASAVSLGLLTETGSRLPEYPRVPEVEDAVAAVRDLCRERGVDVARLANQFSIQRSGCATTLVGTTNPTNLATAIRAVEEPIDEDLLTAVLTITAPVRKTSWQIGLPANSTDHSESSGD